MDHKQIDARSLAFGRALAERVAADRRVIEHARQNLMRWLTTCSIGVRPVLQEWLFVLDGPVEVVVDVLTGQDERAIRLRQSNPFAGVLSQSERNSILRQFHAHDAKSA